MITLPIFGSTTPFNPLAFAWISNIVTTSPLLSPFVKDSTCPNELPLIGITGLPDTLTLKLTTSKDTGKSKSGNVAVNVCLEIDGAGIET